MRQTFWYTRREGVVRGPYPQRQISRYILLGRIRDGDELRPENGGWAPLSACPQLIPEVMKLPDTEQNRQKLLMARMHEDERQPVDRRDRQPVSAEIRERRSGRERRRPESAEELRYRELKYQFTRVAPPTAHPYRVPLLAGVLVVFGLVMAYFLDRLEPPLASPDCSAGPQPGVNWDNCNQIGLVAADADLAGARIRNARMDSARLPHASMAGATLDYSSMNRVDLQRADLSGASLVGATLRGSDLSNSRLVEADLSYANLSGARINGADFSGARLDNTIWVDQRPCAPGSVGVCRRRPD